MLSVSGFRPQEASVPVKEERKKSRPKDVFGRTLPTEEEFAVLKNAPRYNFNYLSYSVTLNAIEWIHLGGVLWSNVHNHIHAVSN